MKAVATAIVILSICMVLMSLSMYGSLLATHSHAAEHNVSERVSNMCLAAVGKPPPSNYGRWVAFAEKRNCNIDLRHYSQLYKDLKPWIDAGRIDHNVFDAVGGAPNEWTGSQCTGPGLTESFDSGGGFNISHKGGIPASATMKSKFYFNGMDNPRSLPSYTSSSKFLNRAYDNRAQVFDDNKCFREHFGRTNFSKSTGNPTYDLISNKNSIREKHGYFMNPVPWKSVDAEHGTTTGSHHGITATISHGAKVTESVLYNGPKITAKSTQTGHSKLPPMDPFQNLLGVDIGFTVFVHSFESAKEVLEKDFGMKKSYDLLVVDGHTWPGRLQRFLQTNSVILYIGVFIDWWNARLKPWEHYVPVQVDFSDLEEKLEWLLWNDDKARQISINAQLVAKKMSRYDKAMCCTGLLMTEYADLYFKGRETVDMDTA
ncbi:hypothetical protein CcCBS67573_g08993 [Chytriomyces confervae]|uniref:Glycosyl transferase CAP10 domain-containing protein n=1 Tax=Chytriomyces confervae TaxID=246404 RepID=A0A507E8T1_9FUNG|nr:hypothetical protein CcCBS67573_g08993 [Chytriomyces confervae]